MFCAKRIKKVWNYHLPKLRWGLAWKITLWYILLLLLTVLMLSALMFWANSQALYKEKQQVLENAASRVLSSLDEQQDGQTMGIRDPEVLKENVPKGVTIQLTSPQGEVLQKNGYSGELLPVEQQAGPKFVY